MPNQVLLIPGKADPGYLSLLLEALDNAYVAVQTPKASSSPADIVRWVQANEHQASCCVVCEQGSSALAVAVAMACGKVPVVVVLLDEATLAAGEGILATTPALVSASRDPDQIAISVARLTGSRAQGSINATSQVVASPPPAPRAPESQPPALKVAKPAPAPASAPPDVVSDDDLAVLRDLERRMKQPVKQPQPKVEVKIQQQPLDFSLPLREALTAARSIASVEGAAAATIDHLAAGVASLPDPAYDAAVRRAGFPVSITKAPASLQMEPAELPPPSAEVFEAMKLAKVIARARGAQCLCIRDVIEAALLNLHPNSELPPEADAALALLPGAEPWENSFFKPSSLDQAGFVEFHSEEFQDIQLRVAPMLEQVEKSKPARKKAVSKAGPPSAKPAPRAAEPPAELQVEEAAEGFPDVDLVEAAADLLLEGQVIALATDSGYMALADATNAGAVARLRGLQQDPAVQVLLHSTAQLKLLVREPLEPHEFFLDAIWPGHVGVVFTNASPILRQIDGEKAVPLRIPADDLTLAVLSMLSRPTAAIDLPEQRLEEQLAGQAALLIRGNAGPVNKLTVVQIENKGRSLVEEGAVSGASLVQWLTEPTQ